MSRLARFRIASIHHVHCVCCFPVKAPSRKAWAPDLFDRFPTGPPRPTRFSATRSASCASTTRRAELGPDGVHAAGALRRERDDVSRAAWTTARPRPRFSPATASANTTRSLAAGVFDFATGLRLVQRRGQLMGQVRGGGMAAVIGLEPARIEAVLAASEAGRRLDVANFNSFEQTVIAGPKDDLAAVKPQIQEARGRVHSAQRERAVPLALHAAHAGRVRRVSEAVHLRGAGHSGHRQRDQPLRTAPTSRGRSRGRSAAPSAGSTRCSTCSITASPIRRGRPRQRADQAGRSDPQAAPGLINAPACRSRRSSS